MGVQRQGGGMDSLGLHRPRNVDWKRAAALLYGDWGTSKAYVIGLAFVAAGYSAARSQSRLLAVTGALLLVADFTVTAAMSGWAALSYLGVPKPLVPLTTVGGILCIGVMNYFGPKHSGSFAVSLAVPTVIVVVAIILLSLPHLALEHLRPSHASFGQKWVAFTGVILALSGVEAIANLTGVMKLDPGTTMESPRVSITARKAILIVMLEVVL